MESSTTPVMKLVHDNPGLKATARRRRREALLLAKNGYMEHRSCSAYIFRSISYKDRVKPGKGCLFLLGTVDVRFRQDQPDWAPWAVYDTKAI